MRKTTRKLSSVDSVPSSASTESDLSPKKIIDSPQKRLGSIPIIELSNARIIQSKLVYIINLPEYMANEETLKSKEYFGQYGLITKCVVNKNTQHTAYQAYITYNSDEEAALCIKACNKFTLDGNELTLTFGTTKYCNYFLRGNLCPKNDCLYLHEFAIEKNVVLRETMPHTKHIQPCNSIFDGIKAIISPPVGNVKLPLARIIRDRTCSEQIFGSPFKGLEDDNKVVIGRKSVLVGFKEGIIGFDGKKKEIVRSKTSRFDFVVDGDETDVPGNMKALRKFSSPKDEVAEIPLIMYEDFQGLIVGEKWAGDVLKIQLGQEKVLVMSKS